MEGSTTDHRAQVGSCWSKVTEKAVAGSESRVQTPLHPAAKKARRAETRAAPEPPGAVVEVGGIVGEGAAVVAGPVAVVEEERPVGAGEVGLTPGRLGRWAVPRAEEGEGAELPQAARSAPARAQTRLVVPRRGTRRG